MSLTDVDERPTTDPDPRPPANLTTAGWIRWAWRQLTSMRTALILLFLLALAAIPGSVIPQQIVDPARAARWRTQHPQLTPTFEKLHLFNVYGSPWFGAIYLLLMVSLVGCVIPRLRVYWRGMRAAPPVAPRHLTRLPEHRTWNTTEPAADVLDRAESVLGKKRFRLRERNDADSVSAQRGYLREAGNLLFHGSLLIVLTGYAIGSLFGFQGTMTIITGNGVSNSVSQYDDYTPGAFFPASNLTPFNFIVNSFHVTFIREGRGAGAASNFYANLTVRTPGAGPRRERISVNHPLTMNGNQVFLLGHGYAPHITIKDGQGNIAYSGTTVFLPERQDLTSFGIVKAPDAQPKQLALEGEFYPTYAFTMKTGPFTAFPDARNPAISMLPYAGDLNMDNGVPQSVYKLDKTRMTLLRKPDGKPARIDLAMGATAQLPDGLGTVTFDGLQRFIRVQVSRSPGNLLTLAGTVLALIGLCGSLFIRPRRIWVRAYETATGTMVEVAGLTRSGGGDLPTELDTLVGALRGRSGQDS